MAKRRSGQAGEASHITGPEEFAARFTVSREIVERLEVYLDLLRRWSAVQDLVAPGTLDDAWHRHFADSAQVLLLAPQARSWLDLGSGAGFPGLVVAILGAETAGFSVQLVEANARKCAFLADVARRTQAPVKIHNARAESLASELSSTPVDIVSARALAPLGRLLGLVHPFLGPKSVALLPKGREALAEISAARMDWRFEVRLHPSCTDPEGRILEVMQLEASKGE